MSEPVQKAKPRLRLRVKPVAETILRSGHPWLFAESIREHNREGQMGELAVIYDKQDNFLAMGLYDPESPLRVRILHYGKPKTLDAAWWTERLQSALHRREGILTAQTTGLRLINGESDGWPGLVLDRYDRTLVLKLYTAAWLPHLDLILPLFHEVLNPQRIVLRLSRNIQKGIGITTGKKDGDVLLGEALNEPVIFLESGLRIEADVLRGQKTGFFLDQRENRRQVELLSAGRKMLNAFSFTGGFSLYAARGGASSVTDLDISRHALESSQRNFSLNSSIPSVAAARHETVQANVFDWLAETRASRFGLIVLDPPSLAKKENERAGAVEAYHKLAAEGIKCLESDGILVACSCSAHVTTQEFFAAVRSAAGKTKRPFTELATTRHAVDHPATFEAAEYLKAIYLRFLS